MDHSEEWRKATLRLSWSFAWVISRGKSTNFKRPTSSPYVNPYKMRMFMGGICTLTLLSKVMITYFKILQLIISVQVINDLSNQNRLGVITPSHNIPKRAILCPVNKRRKVQH